MGMTKHVVGIKLPDEEYKKMAAAYNACVEAGVAVPDKIYRFFDWRDPDPAGMVVEVPHEEWRADMREGFEVHLDKIPDGVQVIRFYCSW